ncbi:Transcription elongation factor [Leptospira biflexa serovar Patoc strain 'Patoc 1 (Ames)']|jgi:regulator of nucleoside diphosphate kinase|uniref:Putative transcription elongation factor n=1 Tax=Leptospira biflexa serovar Patoc (strain Patoc 1 / ATCC 23582 / Paris) TaxID=456481 RepID=B0SN96_LEPBP|nr:nucleoside diphosphate kinase regulator [Leptospira biflexa]ABZ95183.1 Transcription elongation factor [Leptospira biflexa serovar Patoc strain 'Patoc 1 (Ames)']ABZ98863.1 Putative transcription elongation factor [Leptospira biflexa serovar Patoc strain 'Patoc 1 (Paris)']TGM52089.1 nucleoside diphosphate kinase regulator [Leptospira biflexa]
MKTKKKISITNLDYIRLKKMILEYSKRNKTDANVQDLLGEIERAQKVDSKQIPSNVVTMNSVIEIKNLEGIEFKEFRLVYPEDSNLDQNQISILAPIATASIGYKTGDVIFWNVPDGVYRFQITEIKYQPEANGDFHL